MKNKAQIQPTCYIYFRSEHTLHKINTQKGGHQHSTDVTHTQQKDTPAETWIIYDYTYTTKDTPAETWIACDYTYTTKDTAAETWIACDYTYTTKDTPAETWIICDDTYTTIGHTSRDLNHLWLHIHNKGHTSRDLNHLWWHIHNNRTHQQRPKSPVITITWHMSKDTEHELHQVHTRASRATFLATQS